jgi:hypothetical protein
LKPPEWRSSRELRDRAKLFLDAEQLVVFGDAIDAGRSAGFDLTGVRCDCKVGDKGVVSLTRPV